MKKKVQGLKKKIWKIKKRGEKRKIVNKTGKKKLFEEGKKKLWKSALSNEKCNFCFIQHTHKKEVILFLKKGQRNGFKNSDFTHPL